MSRDPDYAMADAQVRARKLEAAISALDEDDLAVSGLKVALHLVRSQAQVPSAWFGRRSSSHGPRSVSIGCARRWSKPSRRSSQRKRRFATKKPFSKMESPALQLFKREAGRAEQPSPVPPTAPAHFATELAMLREYVQELRPERDDLRAELSTGGGGPGKSVEEDKDAGNPLSHLMITDKDQVSSTVWGGGSILLKPPFPHPWGAGRGRAHQSEPEQVWFSCSHPLIQFGVNPFTNQRGLVGSGFNPPSKRGLFKMDLNFKPVEPFEHKGTGEEGLINPSPVTKGGSVQPWGLVSNLFFWLFGTCCNLRMF